MDGVEAGLNAAGSTNGMKARCRRTPACAGWTCIDGGARGLWCGAREEFHEEAKVGVVFGSNTGGDAGDGGGGAGAETSDLAGAANGWRTAAHAGAER